MVDTNETHNIMIFHNAAHTEFFFQILDLVIRTWSSHGWPGDPLRHGKERELVVNDHLLTFLTTYVNNFGMLPILLLSCVNILQRPTGFQKCRKPHIELSSPVWLN